MTPTEKRQEEKRIRILARAAAKRLYPGVKIAPTAWVQVAADGGAFIEVSVFVPAEELK